MLPRDFLFLLWLRYATESELTIWSVQEEVNGPTGGCRFFFFCICSHATIMNDALVVINVFVFVITLLVSRRIT